MVQNVKHLHLLGGPVKRDHVRLFRPNDSLLYCAPENVVCCDLDSDGWVFYSL